MAEALNYPVEIHKLLPGLDKKGPLRIVVLDTAASKTGALSVLRDYYDLVCSLKDGNEWFFITGVKGILKEKPDSPDIHVILKEDVKQSRLKRLLFDHFTGKDYLCKLNPDVIISMQNTLPRGAERLSGTVIYLHQPLGFQNIKKFSFFNKWERPLAVYQYLIAPEIDRSLKRADRIIVQTQWMKDAVVKKDGISPEKIVIMPPEVPEIVELCKHVEMAGTNELCKLRGVGGADELCKSGDARDFGELCKHKETRQFIYPAGPILYKDHQCIVNALKILCDRGIRDMKVIFTERKENLPWVEVPECCRDLIEWRGMIKREELLKLYRTSVMLFPSYIETFGLPLAEACKAGIPVIAADTPFAREILSGYDKASFFKASDSKALADLMEVNGDGSH